MKIKRYKRELFLAELKILDENRMVTQKNVELYQQDAQHLQQTRSALFISEVRFSPPPSISDDHRQKDIELGKQLGRTVRG